MTSPTTITYFGNQLQRHGRSPTVIDTLAPLLARNFAVTTASDVGPQALRLLHMVWVLMRRRKNDFVLIDT